MEALRVELHTPADMCSKFRFLLHLRPTRSASYTWGFVSAYPVGHREARSKSFLNPSKQALHLLLSVSSNIPSNTELKYVQIWGGSPSPNSYRHTLTLRVCEVNKSLLNQTLVENMLCFAVTTIRWVDPTSTASWLNASRRQLR